jgi:hypothetical protein
MNAVHLAGTIALWLGLVSSAALCGLYHLTAPWWRSAEGRHLMSFTGGLALILSWLAYRSVFAAPPPTAGDEVGRTVVAVLMVWRLALLWRRQIRPAFRRDEGEEKLMPLPARKEAPMARIEIPDPVAGPTEPDEEAVLAGLYGEADSDGVFRGQGQAPRDDGAELAGPTQEGLV